HKILKNDLENGVDFFTMSNNITQDEDKAFLYHQINKLIKIDNDIDEREKVLLEGWRNHLVKGINLDSLDKIIEIIEKNTFHEDQHYQLSKKNSFIKSALNQFLKI